MGYLLPAIIDKLIQNDFQLIGKLTDSNELKKFKLKQTDLIMSIDSNNFFIIRSWFSIKNYGITDKNLHYIIPSNLSLKKIIHMILPLFANDSMNKNISINNQVVSDKSNESNELNETNKINITDMKYSKVSDGPIINDYLIINYTDSDYGYESIYVYEYDSFNLFRNNRVQILHYSLENNFELIISSINCIRTIIAKNPNKKS